MSDPFIGMIIQVGFNFAPLGWHACDGATLPISQNTALFSLLGTTYGGNGTTTFQLPDLRSRVAIGVGQGIGLSPYVEGQQSGAEGVSLTVANLPAHTHSATFASNSSFSATTTKATLQSPAAGSVLGHSVDGAPNPAALPEIYCPSGTAPNVALSGLNVAGSVGVGVTGNGLPVQTLPPCLAILNVIAMQGIYPSRSWPLKWLGQFVFNPA
jgi:microcystin-dependent protein